MRINKIARSKQTAAISGAFRRLFRRKKVSYITVHEINLLFLRGKPQDLTKLTWLIVHSDQERLLARYVYSRIDKISGKILEGKDKTLLETLVMYSKERKTRERALGKLRVIKAYDTIANLLDSGVDEEMQKTCRGIIIKDFESMIMEKRVGAILRALIATPRKALREKLVDALLGDILNPYKMIRKLVEIKEYRVIADLLERTPDYRLKKQCLVLLEKNKEEIESKGYAYTQRVMEESRNDPKIRRGY